MGDPKKNRRKYTKPSHPWQAGRLKEESELLKRFGLKNKKELWKMVSIIKNVKKQAKNLIAGYSEQSEKEKKQLIARLIRLGLLGENASLDDILGLKLESIFERRLQTLVYKFGLTKSVKQARQFVVYGHIAINGKRVNVPSYLVKKEEESKVSFYINSKLNREDHPERTIQKIKEEIKEEKKNIEQPVEEKLVEVEAK